MCAPPFCLLPLLPCCCCLDHYRHQVVIAPEYMVGGNKQVKSRQLWGKDVYTDDSDLVAVLLHLGYYASNNVAPNSLVSRFYAQILLGPKQASYQSCTRNAVRSRCWFSDAPGCSYQVRVCACHECVRACVCVSVTSAVCVCVCLCLCW